ncbi:MAG: YggS family pyridoxal phosphate-dependent enzyme [Aureliella sp.]
MQASNETAKQIRDNWLLVQDEVNDACGRCGRDSSEVKIVGVSKYVDPPFAAQLVQAGCDVLGENRPQHLWAAAEHFKAENIQARWHMIGHLQRNKIRRTLPLLEYLHSLDSPRLASALHEELDARDGQLRVLVEVNVTEDTEKTGLAANQLHEFLESLTQLPRLKVCGLMAMTTLGASTDQAAREFNSVRELRDKAQDQFGTTFDLSELSMGMSGDFPQAIAAGATLVRIGTRLWHGCRS